MTLDMAAVAATIRSLPPSQQREAIEAIELINEVKRREASEKDFLSFVKEVWPAFIEGEHHKIMSDAFNRIADGTLKRLIVNMPPRHTKSEFASHLFPAWYLGRFPDKKVIQTAHTAELAVGFCRKVRNCT